MEKKADMVSFNYPGYSYFNILEIMNNSEEGVEFLTEAYVIKELVATSSKIENSKNIVINGQVVIVKKLKQVKAIGSMI